MDAIALGLQQSDSSNFLNFHASVNLSMSRSRPTVFSSTELLDVDFLVQRGPTTEAVTVAPATVGDPSLIPSLPLMARTFSNVMFSPWGTSR